MLYVAYGEQFLSIHHHKVHLICSQHTMLYKFLYEINSVTFSFSLLSQSQH